MKNNETNLYDVTVDVIGEKNKGERRVNLGGFGDLKSAKLAYNSYIINNGYKNMLPLNELSDESSSEVFVFA